MTTKIDFKKEMKPFSQPPVGKFVDVTLPQLQFVMINGSGDPNKSPAYSKALEWL